MSARGGGRARYRNNRGHNKGNRPNLSSDEGKRQRCDENVDKTSPIYQAFLGFQKELDGRNDRYERIVKLSRDITIESKRIIFLLQRVAGSVEREDLLKEASIKIEELHKSKFLVLARELHGQDPFQFLRAYSPGVQEYIEAVTFYHYLLNESLVSLDKIQSELVFSESSQNSLPSELNETPSSAQSSEERTTGLSNVQCNETRAASSAGVSDVKESQEHSLNKMEDEDTPECKEENLRTVIIPPCEYMLGVADFTGELMRMAINSVGAGDLETPAVVTTMMRLIHDAFTTFNNVPRELRHKTHVLSQSLQKVERACYTLKVRGSEIPKHMLADVFSSGSSMTQDTFVTEDTDIYD